ncbi:MAG: hypothetical protein KBD65_02735 [Candidatus Moranbacteria bacterium]|nr:hypothetical protein [Candidatus Moranbacteria bacterium]
MLIEDRVEGSYCPHSEGEDVRRSPQRLKDEQVLRLWRSALRLYVDGAHGDARATMRVLRSGAHKLPQGFWPLYRRIEKVIGKR